MVSLPIHTAFFFPPPHIDTMARSYLMAVALLGCLVLAAGQTVPAPTKPVVAPMKPAVAPVKPEVAPAKPEVAPAKPAVAPTKPAVAPVKPAAPACTFIDLSTKPYSERPLCSSQVNTAAKKILVTPKSIDSVMVISDLACQLLKFGSSDPAGTVWGGAAGRCFNGDKYVTGETLVALKCCPAGAKASSALARARDTNAESGVKVGGDLVSLARERDTAADMGTQPGSADLAKLRDTQADSGVKPGSAEFARQRETQGEGGCKPGSSENC